MSQQFNPLRVMRQLTEPLFLELCEQAGEPISKDTWEWGESRVEQLFRAFQRMETKPRVKVEQVLQMVDELSLDHGLATVSKEAHARGINLHAEFPGAASQHDKILWSWLHYPEIFESAVMFQRADTLPSRWWTRRPGLPNLEPGTGDEDLVRFQDALSAYFVTKEGRGHHCLVEHLHRESHQDYYFVYLSDYASTYVGFDEEGAFRCSPARGAFEVVYAYDRVAGHLDLHARGGKKVSATLQEIFGETMLGVTIDSDPTPPPYRLDHLLDPNVQLLTDPTDGIELSAIRAMRLGIIGRDRDVITLETGPAPQPGEIHEMLERDLDRQRLPRALLKPLRVTFLLKFVTGFGYGRSLTFSVTPRSCDLKSKRELQRNVGEKYLRRWRICNDAA